MVTALPCRLPQLKVARVFSPISSPLWASLWTHVHTKGSITVLAFLGRGHGSPNIPWFRYLDSCVHSTNYFHLRGNTRFVCLPSVKCHIILVLSQTPVHPLVARQKVETSGRLSLSHHGMASTQIFLIFDHSQYVQDCVKSRLELRSCTSEQI